MNLISSRAPRWWMFWKNICRPEKPGPRSGTISPNILDPPITGLFEEILKAGTRLRVRVTGRSMTPFLSGGETVTLKQVPLTLLRRGDLIFFKNSHAVPLLHRIVHKRSASDGTITFLTKGDALLSLDEPVRDRNVLGKVCKIEKKHSKGVLKTINMESNRWRLINSIIAIIGFATSGLFHLWGNIKRSSAVEGVPFKTNRPNGML